MSEASDIEIFPKPRSLADQSYKLFAQILSGFEIAPTLAVDSLNTKVDIKIGNASSYKDPIITES